jgi:hypothetical protein
MKFINSKNEMRFLISALCIAMLAGCGGGGGSSYSASSSSSSSTTSTPTYTTPTPTPTIYNTAQLILPPSVPQPQVSGDIVGFNLENTTTSNIAAHIFTFGQIFKSGDVQPTDTLVAHINGTAYQVQLDTLATWPNGSVKLGSITLQMPAINAGSTLPVLLSKTTGSAATPVDLANATINLNVTLTFTSGQYGGTKPFDLGTVLKTALATSPTYWLHGPLATQARIDVPLTGGPLHITADVTAFADGSFTADVQFNNDLTTILPSTGTVNPHAALPPIQYTATINLQGASINRTISQIQYTGWHVVLNSAGAPVLSASSSTGSAINVQHDLAYLEHSGAILSYDRTTGVANVPAQSGTAFYSIENIMANTGFGTPFASNGVLTYMPTTGGRADIGYTTQWNTVWLMTQDARAAIVCLAQGDTGGAVPWNFKLANGHWLTPGDNPNIWTSSSSGPQSYTDGIANVPDTSVWTPDSAHQPNLAYVPYIMTGQRWYLDRLNAQAAYSETTMPPYNSGPYQASGRFAGQLLTGTIPSLAGTADIVITPGNQLRASAWSMREIQEAAWVGKPGSFEQGFFGQAVLDNWNYFLAVEATLTASQGAAVGWLPSVYGSSNIPVIMSPAQQDYFTGIAALGARMGYTGALEYINWQRDGWLSGRFIAAGMNPYDGTAYNMDMSDSLGNILTTWAAIENATVTYCSDPNNGCTTNGSSFPTTNEYAQWARGALGAALTLYPSDTNLQQALNFVQLHGTFVDQGSLQSDPTFNVVQLQ